MIVMDAGYSPAFGLTIGAILLLMLFVVAAVVVAIYLIVRAIRRKPLPPTPYSQMAQPGGPGWSEPPIVPPLSGDAPSPPQ